MRQVTIWFWLSCKRCLKRLPFILILLVLPAASYFLREVEKEEGQEVGIAVYAGGEEALDEKSDRGAQEGRGAGEGRKAGGPQAERPLEQLLAEELTEREDGGLFCFYLCGSEEQVKEEVASGRAECGYVISGDLRRKLDEKDYRRCIRVYSAPSTVLASLSTEVVSAALVKLYDREIFLDYIVESEEVRYAVNRLGASIDDSGAEEILRSQAGALYDKWMGNGSTFRFEYGYRSSRGQIREEDPAPRVFPVRGIVAVYLFLVGLYSAVLVGEDQARGLFLPLSRRKRRLCSLAALAAPVFLAAVSALAALKTGGCLLEPGRELAVMGGYLAAVCIFSAAMKLVCRRPQVLCCVIPMLLVGSLVFTPVFLDIRQFFPALGWAERLFLPSYYLRAF